MLSVIIPTHESERQVVRTLACLVSGATAGIVREVILADAGSHDETEKVADVAGCRFLSLPGPPGARLSAAAQQARGAWLLFLQPGAVLDPEWVAEVERFLMGAGGGKRIAATFRTQRNEERSLSAQFLGLLRQALGARPRPEQGLLLTKADYSRLGGHTDDTPNPASALLRRIGRQRIVVLRAAARGHFHE
jgi:glycosyltransferase involved in cell wall biosynthesis